MSDVRKFKILEGVNVETGAKSLSIMPYDGMWGNLINENVKGTDAVLFSDYQELKEEADKLVSCLEEIKSGPCCQVCECHACNAKKSLTEFHKKFPKGEK